MPLNNRPVMRIEGIVNCHNLKYRRGIINISPTAPKKINIVIAKILGRGIAVINPAGIRTGKAQKVLIAVNTHFFFRPDQSFLRFKKTPITVAGSMKEQTYASIKIAVVMTCPY